MRHARTILLASTLLTASGLSAHAEVNVVASIKPIHSLVAAVMEGVGKPGLIVEGAGSPHNYALKPSQAQMLESADVVFWVGRELEAFLEKPLETIAASAKSIELIDAHDLVRLGFREGGAFESHDPDGEDGHEGHMEAEHDHDHDEKAAAHEHDHDTAANAGHDDDHAHGEFDAHIWLDPINAKAMVQEIEEALASVDPANAARYQANAEAVSARLDTLITGVSAELEPVKDKGFIVFHDGYHYFENRFGVTAAGSITVSPEVMPGAERITEIRAKLQELGAACVFAEPQFEPKLVSTVIEGTKAKSGIIDPLGAELADGPDLYFQVIDNMASSIKSCLSEAS
jgi:zinc transport system substrate-binding protein